MTTAVIVAIVVAAIILVALLVMLPRMRHKAVERRHVRELESRRSAEAKRQRSEASERERRAEIAEQEARMARQKAERDRADAQLHEERARMHERGMADHDLIEDHERDKFAGVAGVGRDRDDDGVRDSAEPAAAAPDDRAMATDRDDRATTAGTGEGRTEAYEQGRMSVHDDERREAFKEGRADEGGGLLSRFKRDDSADRVKH